MEVMSAAAERRVRVELEARSYDVVIGSGLLERAGALMAPLLERKRRLIVVTDERVGPLHLGRLQAGLGAVGLTADVLTVGGGEPAKSWTELGRLLDRLLA